MVIAINDRLAGKGHVHEILEHINVTRIPTALHNTRIHWSLGRNRLGGTLVREHNVVLAPSAQPSTRPDVGVAYSRA